MTRATPQKNLVQTREVSSGLFDDILTAIHVEQESKKAKQMISGLVALTILSVGTLPFSWYVFLRSWSASGVNYFFDSIVRNGDVVIRFWQDALLSVFESLPLVAMIILAVNIALILLAIQLLLYKQRMILSYIKNIHSYGTK